MFNSRTISIRIDRPYREVYAFLAEPLNFPTWASNLGATFEHVGGDEWVTETRSGRVFFTFAPRNRHGIVDHSVRPEGGEAVPTPMRVIRNGSGAEILITLLQVAGMSDEAFRSEAEWVVSDFEALRSLLETAPSEIVVL